ncbi:NAD-dependent epimerase/dehydratase family protein [Antrihabitans sp. YC3-6]|uniref:NAD-dependent epimerase/dehydratase family protein n=1 Tax=Antrihabitans stalagmiti TaxID=2799499 RepID=A0A934NW37_9NOCA|nr:NAD-dependent epimerase/dehydratase family protein [Antrihabitans stalagmiti]MBJ8342353.1 NAD-dependent epimerase/dehydratase family protein [Antrihabitans stalagmiti]
MTVAVTGASGYLGVNLVRQLVADGETVRALDVARSPHFPSGVEFRKANVLDPESIRAALTGVDTVYHLVAKITLSEQDEIAWRLNVDGARNTAEAALAAGVRRYVHCSSIHAFDQYRCQEIDETSPRSEDGKIPVYDRSKWAGEQQVQEVVKAGLDAVICNPTGVYGPTDFGMAGLSRINGLIAMATRGRMPVTLEGGFDLVDVRDVATGLVAAADRGRTGENYLLAGEFCVMADVFRRAAKKAGRSGRIAAVPLRAVLPMIPIAERIGKRFGSDLISAGSLAALVASPRIDNAKAVTELGYRARTSAQTVDDLVEFLQFSRTQSQRA